MSEIPNLRSHIDKMKLNYGTAKAKQAQLKLSVVQAEFKLTQSNEALEYAREIASNIQSQAHGYIERIVNRCFDAILDEPYEFKIIIDKKRNKTEARLVFIRDGCEIDPLTASGGGVVDIAAFALRLACMTLHSPKLRPILIMDEPFRFVSDSLRPKVAELLLSLSKELGVQIIMVTHISELEIGKVVRV